MRIPRFGAHCFVSVASLVSACGHKATESRAEIAAQSANVTASAPTSDEVACDANPRSCCPSGTTVVQLTSSDDTVSLTVNNRCLLALAGSDTVMLTSTAGTTAVFGGPGDDTLNIGGAASQIVHGGTDNDTLYVWGGGSTVFGNEGDDTIFAGNGNNVVVPGPGMDNTTTGDGDDTVVINDICELVSGEQIDTGKGNDTLISPVPLSELVAMNISVKNVEKVVVQQNSCKSQCVMRPTCVHGKCAETSVPGVVGCACDPSWKGQNCDVPKDPKCDP